MSNKKIPYRDAAQEMLDSLDKLYEQSSYLRDAGTYTQKEALNKFREHAQHCFQALYKLRDNSGDDLVYDLNSK